MRLVLIMILMACGAVLPARADEASTMALCRNAAISAADAHGVPREVMVAISLVETRTRRGGVSGPWPWTVNVAGKGFWFDSRAAALIHAQRALARGQRSFDVGCFQLNYRWHGEHFASIDEMFEPGPSGDYAARFVKSLHAETGDWIKASGLYHSRTQKHAKRYRGLVARTVSAMGGKVPQPQALARTQTVAAAGHPGGRVIRTGDGGIPWRAGPGRVRVPSDTRSAAGGVGLHVLRRPTGRLVGGG